jgi:membrane-bound lytic murein transglycosylase MltF
MEGPLSWAMQKNTPQLKATVDEFVTDHRIGTSYGNTVVRKYLNDIKWVQDATARKDLERFQRLVKFFREYGDKYRFPYLLLAAQGYQESRLDPRLRSRAGAIGVMQIKPSTAAASPIGITDIQKTDRNVEAGAKYLRYMVKQYYENEPMDPVRKGLFALASYNAGPNTIRKLRAEAAAEGYDPNRWFNNVEIIASKRMGNETVQYVSNIYRSERESDKVGRLRGFADSAHGEEFQVADRQALGLEQKVTEVLVATAAIDEHADVAVDGFYHAHANLGPAVVRNAVHVLQ